jgi:hypothetical protein
MWQDCSLLLNRLQTMVHLHDPTLSMFSSISFHCYRSASRPSCSLFMSFMQYDIGGWPIVGMPLLDEEVELRGFAYLTTAYPSSASRFDFAERRSGRYRSMVDAAARPTRARGDRKERPGADDALRRHKILQFGHNIGIPQDVSSIYNS